MVKLINSIAKVLKGLRQLWRQGGITPVNVLQVHRGSVLAGKRVLITGGSSGIGRAIAEKCLSEGAHVVITGRGAARLEDAVQSLGSPNVYSLVWDVSDVSIVNEKLAEAIELFGGLPDVLVNNAGLLGGARHILDLTEAHWDKLLSVNSKGLVFLTQSTVRRWIELKMPAKIINMSSMRGTLGVKDGPYGMSKWALNGLTHGLGRELAPKGIIVNGIAPGMIATDSIGLEGLDPLENAHLDYIPTKRIGLPEEIAELAVFLMSDAGNYIVGQTIVCDGGYTLRS